MRLLLIQDKGKIHTQILLNINHVTVRQQHPERRLGGWFRVSRPSPGAHRHDAKARFQARRDTDFIPVYLGSSFRPPQVFLTQICIQGFAKPVRPESSVCVTGMHPLLYPSY